ncbi:FRIGIDA-like protein 3 [Tasmannia lanceolata]|uniref:FRIGIDA-like protein 3 n=1 Tax=Tasmannia lanceolata TaxID=3420 RepID=UPI0040628696
MADTHSVATLIDSTTSKIQQLQQAFAELESHRAVSLNLKWKELEEHFHGLERSLKKRFVELENQEKEYETKASEALEMLEKRKVIVVAKEEASLERLQEKRDAALSAIGKYNKKVKPRPQLIKLCEEMDAKGLHKFISDNRKNLAAIREEIPFALKSATDPTQLVLDSLEDFYHVEIPSLDGKKDSSLVNLRRTCIMLMQSLGQLMISGNPDSDSDNQVILSDIREQAKVIADQWKPKLDNLDVDASSGNSLEAHAFLQLLATFGIASEFDHDELCKLIPAVSRRRHMADLCRSFDLAEKMPGVIEVLANSGRQIEAVNLAFAFQLTEQFDPISLLEAYLEEKRKASQVKAGNTSPSAQNEVNDRELSALKAVIKCIEEHKLEEQYPIDPLQKRILQLEEAKADKKRAAEAAKPQSKRPRANGGSYAPRVTNNIPEKSFYRGPERYPYVYERPYVYATDNHGSSLLGTYNISPGHGSYYGNGYQYPTPYLLH